MSTIRFGLTGVIAVTLLLVLASSNGSTLASQNATPSAPKALSQAAPPEPTSVLVCYNVQRGDDVRADVRLVTQNFGGDLVRVRSLALMCEQSVKYHPVPGELDPPPPADPRIFACYNVDRGHNPDDPYILDTSNFGPDGVVVQQSNLMCEAGEKHLANGDVTGHATGHIWQCFRLNQGENPGAAVRVNNQNFGRDDIEVARSVQMCETAAKERLTASGAVVTSGTATGDVLQCFRVLDGQNVNTPAVLFTQNFGRDEVVIRSPALMCEPAEKTPVYIFGVAVNPDAASEP